jgi:hypothetical protein
MNKQKINKSQFIQQYKKDFPFVSNQHIADLIGVTKNYVAHILWRSKKPVMTKLDWKNAHEQLSVLNSLLKEEIVLLEQKIDEQKRVIKYLKDN